MKGNEETAIEWRHKRNNTMDKYRYDDFEESAERAFSSLLLSIISRRVKQLVPTGLSCKYTSKFILGKYWCELNIKLVASGMPVPVIEPVSKRASVVAMLPSASYRMAILK